MSGEPEGSASADASHARRWNAWRIGTPLVVLICGVLFVVSAESSEGTDLRPGRYDDLSGLVESEASRFERLSAKVTALTDEVASLSAAIDDDAVQRLTEKADNMRSPAGLTQRVGAGVKITLTDAPDELIDATEGNKNPLVVHQQDIQAVVNALWNGGASAVTIQGQRVITTTGIKCEDSLVLLQGVPYPQPYVIEAVGDPGTLASAVSDDAYLQLYRQQSANPVIAVGWSFELVDQVTAPAYDGVLRTTYARPLT